MLKASAYRKGLETAEKYILDNSIAKIFGIVTAVQIFFSIYQVKLSILFRLILQKLKINSELMLESIYVNAISVHIEKLLAC